MVRMMKIISIVFAAILPLSGCTNFSTDIDDTPSPVISSQPETVYEDNLENEANMGNGITLTLKDTYEGFNAPTGIAVDRDGNLYVSNWSGSTVTKVDSQGNQTIFADGMGSPAGLAFDDDDNLFVSDYAKDVIYKVTPDGIKTIFAQGFHTPTGISFNNAGELLVANRGSNEIVKVDASGNVELVADGMRTPVGVVEDLNGDLYVTNYGGGIIKITVDGIVSTFSDDFGRPGVGIDRMQNIIFAADNGDGCVRMIASDGSTEIVVDNIGGSVALLVHENILYVGSWNNGAVYSYSIE
jgi:sugar lactone lactonase YvrE